MSKKSKNNKKAFSECIYSESTIRIVEKTMTW